MLVVVEVPAPPPAMVSPGIRNESGGATGAAELFGSTPNPVVLSASVAVSGSPRPSHALNASAQAITSTLRLYMAASS
jgi:hypothetical protein